MLSDAFPQGFRHPPDGEHPYDAVRCELVTSQKIAAVDWSAHTPKRVTHRDSSAETHGQYPFGRLS